MTDAPQPTTDIKILGPAADTTAVSDPNAAPKTNDGGYVLKLPNFETLPPSLQAAAQQLAKLVDIHNAGGSIAGVESVAAASSLFDDLAAHYIAGKTGDGKKMKLGVTLKMLADHLNIKKATPAMLASVTADLATDILKSRYWEKLGADGMPEPVAAVLFDVAVRRGLDVANKLLVEGLQNTGAAGVDDKTLPADISTAIANVDPHQLAQQILAHRSTAKWRLGDGKILGKDIDWAGAALLAGRALRVAKLAGLL